MSIGTCVIVGAGIGGASAVGTLRDEGYDGRIVLIGTEPHLPYSRPPLSKDVVQGATPPEQTELRPEAWYEEQMVDLELGTTAVAIDPAGRVVELAGGRTIAYDALLLATGGTPRTLPVPGAALDGVVTLRTIEDSIRIRDHLATGAPLVVVGAGFIGAEVAASARMLGHEVTVLEILDVPLSRALGEEMGSIYADIHRQRGVNLLTGVGAEGFVGDDHVTGILLSDGTSVETELVVVGVGLEPSLALAEVSGLAVGNGIIVDEFCETSAPGVFAAGDVANHPNRFVGERVRLEHWQNAQHQAQVAAQNMLGRKVPFDEVPWFWSDQFDLKMQMVGRPRYDDATALRGDPASGSFTMFYLRDSLLTAALAVNRPRDMRACRTLIQQGARVDAAALRDPDTDLAALTRAADAPQGAVTGQASGGGVSPT